MARYIVDGMNVVGSRPDGWWKDRPGAMCRLVDHLAAWQARAGHEVVAIFDGRLPPSFEPPPGLEVGFAPAADDDIVGRVTADPDPSSLIVVTSDAGLAARVRPFGVTVAGSGGFRRQLEEH